MALQYLDGSAIANFVVLRSSGGDFQGSWSMTNTMRYQQGDTSSAVLIGADGQEMGLEIIFEEIDWASCDPVPADYSTDEAIMTYLCTYLFTGQQGTLVPPAPINMGQLNSKNFTLNESSDGDYFCSPLAAPEMVDLEQVAILGNDYTPQKCYIYIVTNTLENDVDVLVIKDSGGIQTTLFSGAIATTDTGRIEIPLVKAETVATTELLAIKYTVAAGLGSVEISNSMITYES